jgi:Protein of unknown function (DUF4058)
MSSPFPGMDPYLEHPKFWSSFHFRLIGAIASALTPQLSDQYYIEVELRTYQSDTDDEVLIGIPDAAIVGRQSQERLPRETPAATAIAFMTVPETVMLPTLELIKERYLEIRDIKTDAVITVIEVLSPKNKQAGEGHNTYEKKRRCILESATHLVEIDLIRAGKAMPIVSTRPPTAYRILVSRSPQRPAAELYALSLQTSLPTILIPLKPGDPDLILNLQALVDQIYDEARYRMRIDYTEPVPPPALRTDDRQWLETSNLGE